MCALFTLRTSHQQMLTSFGMEFESRLHDQEWDHRFLPHQMIPVLRWMEGSFILSEMNFSLIPHWSKVRRPKFATHNARLESLAEKPTWREPLVRRHGLIPLSEFIEPIYEGEHKGHMLGFSEKEDSLLWAAALWDEWVDTQTGECIPSATIITHSPSEYVAKMGHDREPLFINKKSFSPWLKMDLSFSDPLNGSKKSLKESPHEKGPRWLAFLQAAHDEPSLKVRRDRVLKKYKE